MDFNTVLELIILGVLLYLGYQARRIQKIEGVFDIKEKDIITSADGEKEDFSDLGTKHIYYNKKTMKYTVQKVINNHKYFLGSFDTLEDAQKARDKFLREHQKGM